MIAATSMQLPAIAQAVPKVAEVSDIAPVWAGHSTKYVLHTRGDDQFVAYYDPNRDMTFAKRTAIPSATGQPRAWGPWQIHKVPIDQPSPWGERATPTRTGWDSHNYIAFAFDDTGRIHLSGNMHNNPLMYFRTEEPGDITTFRRVDRMLGTEENTVTYPVFIVGPDGRLYFTYRHGHSGNGMTILNGYDSSTQQWTRVIGGPLFDGSVKPGIRDQSCNAYPIGPVVGPDGYFHYIWVWRNTPACETTHSVCYVRSRDLRHWEFASGKPATLPITPENVELVDPVPVHGGLINGCTQIGFDTAGRVVLSYHKFDRAGRTQIYNARFDGQKWNIVPATRWTFRWDFRGSSSVRTEVRLRPIEVTPDGRLLQRFWNIQDGWSGTYLHPDTLEPLGVAPPALSLPAELSRLESTFPGIEVRTNDDTGSSPAAEGRWVLRWEMMPVNRDKPLEGPPPPPSMLRLYRIVDDLPQP